MGLFPCLPLGFLSHFLSCSAEIQVLFNYLESPSRGLNVNIFSGTKYIKIDSHDLGYKLTGVFHDHSFGPLTDFTEGYTGSYFLVFLFYSCTILFFMS